MRVSSALMLSGAIALCTSGCDPGPTVYLGKREVTPDASVDAGSDARAHEQEHDRSEEGEQEEE